MRLCVGRERRLRINSTIFGAAMGHSLVTLFIGPSPLPFLLSLGRGYHRGVDASRKGGSPTRLSARSSRSRKLYAAKRWTAMGCRGRGKREPRHGLERDGRAILRASGTGQQRLTRIKRRAKGGGGRVHSDSRAQSRVVKSTSPGAAVGRDCRWDAAIWPKLGSLRSCSSA